MGKCLRALPKPILVALSFLILLIFLAWLIPIFSCYSVSETHLLQKNLSPCKTFWFGTDELGRDLFTRCFYGIRISLIVGTTAALIDLTVGSLYGAIAAFSGKILEETMMRLIDILATIPYLLFVILLMVFLGPGIITVLIALTFTGWIPMARVVRSEILRIRRLDFIKALHLLGASFWRILFKHLLPNCLSSIIVAATLTIPTAIFSEAFLSFLGLGIQAPYASLGAMVNEGLPALSYYPWRLFIPAIFISLLILLFHTLGDALRDYLDPRESL